MTVALALATLALVDCMLAGFRAAAGRNGRLEKHRYYVRAVVRAGAWGLVLVAVHASLAGLLCMLSPSSAATWGALLEAARRLVLVYGTFATLTLLAFGFYFAPIGDFRVLTNVIVFGPLTLGRRAVIVLGLADAVARTPRLEVIVLAVSAGLSMCSFEALLARKYTRQWERLMPGAS